MKWVLGGSTLLITALLAACRVVEESEPKTAPRAEPVAALILDLLDPSRAPDAFAELTAPLKGWSLGGLRFEEAYAIRGREDELLLVVAALTGGFCVWGAQWSGVVVEQIEEPQVRAASLLAFDVRGRALWHLTHSGGLSIADLDGDGLCHELLQWSRLYYGEGTPFLRVYDVTSPQLTSMLAISLDPGVVEWPPDTTEVLCTFVRTPTSEFHIRHEGVIDRFQYDDKLRQWDMPVRRENAIWNPLDADTYRWAFHFDQESTPPANR